MTKFAFTLIATLLVTQTVHILNIDDKLSAQWRDWNTVDAVKQKSVWLNDYHLEGQATIPGIRDNLSGLTYNPDTNSYWSIINSPQKMLELDKDFNVIRTVELVNFDDTEALSYAGNQQMVIADERDQSIVIASIDEHTTRLDKNRLQRITLDTSGGNNKGFEGIAVDRHKDIIYVVRERDPMKLLAVHGLLGDGNSIKIEDHPSIDVNQLPIDDLSGLHLDGNSGNLLLLSDESKLLTEVSPSGATVSFLELDSGFHGLNQAVPQAEGVALGPDGSILIVSEPNLIYRFAKHL